MHLLNFFREAAKKGSATFLFCGLPYIIQKPKFWEKKYLLFQIGGEKGLIHFTALSSQCLFLINFAYKTKQTYFRGCFTKFHCTMFDCLKNNSLFASPLGLMDCWSSNASLRHHERTETKRIKKLNLLMLDKLEFLK